MVSPSDPPIRPEPKRQNRLGYLDWLRGLAGFIMLQGHVFHSFTAKELREGSASYQISQFIGGMPPAIFLFLTGVTLSFLMDSGDRKGLDPWGKIWAVLKRAGYLFALAYLFRLQLWIFGLPKSPISDVFKVDILNCMGLAIAVFSLMSVFTTVERIRLCAVLGLGIAAASPVVASLPWDQAPMLIRTYLAPDYNFFSFFPWASFLAFGVSAGSILRVMKKEDIERSMQWFAVGGMALIMAARWGANLPWSFYEKSDFWLTSPALVLIKLGVIMAGLAVAYLWSERITGDKWSWMRVIGTNSLLIYWVHIELVYGRWFWMWKENLSVPATVAMSVAVIAAMIGLCVAKDRWREWWPSTRPQPEPVPVKAD